MVLQLDGVPHNGMVLEWYFKYRNGSGFGMVVQVLDWYSRYWNDLEWYRNGPESQVLDRAPGTGIQEWPCF